MELEGEVEWVSFACPFAGAGSEEGTGAVWRTTTGEGVFVSVGEELVSASLFRWCSPILAARKFLAESGDWREDGEPGECEVDLTACEPGGDSLKSTGSVEPRSNLSRLTDILICTGEVSPLLVGDCALNCKDSPGGLFVLDWY